MNSCKVLQIRYASVERLLERLTDLRFLSIDFLNTLLPRVLQRRRGAGQAHHHLQEAHQRHPSTVRHAPQKKKMTRAIVSGERKLCSAALRYQTVEERVCCWVLSAAKARESS